MSGMSMVFFGLFMLTTPGLLYFTSRKDEDVDIPTWMHHQPLQVILFLRCCVLAGGGVMGSGLLLHAASMGIVR